METRAHGKSLPAGRHWKIKSGGIIERMPGGMAFDNPHPNSGAPLRMKVNGENKLDGFHQLKVGWLGNGISIFHHRGKVHFHYLCHPRSRFLQSAASRHTSRQVWRVRAKTRSGFLEEDYVFVRSKSACFTIVLCVFGGTSSDSCPATVTFPIAQRPAILPKQFQDVADLHRYFFTNFITPFVTSATYRSPFGLTVI